MTLVLEDGMDQTVQNVLPILGRLDNVTHVLLDGLERTVTCAGLVTVHRVTALNVSREVFGRASGCMRMVVGQLC